jgi:MFS family permease
MVGAAAFSVTFFVPAAATTVFKMDAVEASFVISTGYICAIFLNLLFGYLMDHYNKWIVLSSLVVFLIPASVAMTSGNELVFRSPCRGARRRVHRGNQVCGLAGSVLRGRERKCDGRGWPGSWNIRLCRPSNVGCSARSNERFQRGLVHDGGSRITDLYRTIAPKTV